jgi:tetratricopeptide (TPR) repeat protein
MPRIPERGPRNTREFLPPTRQVKLVPMSAEDFQRARRKRMLKWAIPAALFLIIAVVIVIRSPEARLAQNDYLTGKRAFEAGKLPEALAALDRAITQKNNLMDAYQLRAAVYLALHRSADALQDVSKVIDMRPDILDNFALRAQIEREQGNYPAAIADYTHIIQKNPTEVAYSGRGLCHRAQGNLKLAAEDFTKAIQLEPGVENYLQRGAVYAELREHRKAIEDFTYSIHLKPESPYAYRSRANSREAVGDRAGASQDRAKAQQIESPVR